MSQPRHRFSNGSVVNRLLWRYRESLAPDATGSEVKVLHRLDQFTSGVCVYARTTDAARHVHKQFRQGSVRKSYVAVVHGVPGPVGHRWTCEAPIGELVEPRDDGRNYARAVGDDCVNGKHACTDFEVVAAAPPHAAVVRCAPRTGRTHQIRLHLLDAGNPIVGDHLYATPEHHKALLDVLGDRAAHAAVAPALDRQMLHAAALVFAHPEDEALVELEAPLPDDMAALVGALDLTL